MEMSLTKRLAGLTIAAAMIVAALAMFRAIDMAGFPDGDVRDVQRALIPIDATIAFTLGMFGLLTAYFAFWKPARLFKFRWWFVVVVLAVSWLGRMGYLHYLRTFLDYGQGG